MHKTKITKILIFLLSSSFFGNIIFAEGIDVSANIPSGKYSEIIKVELTPTNPSARTFYSFNPNGGPSDALLYTGAIIIKKSTPLVFFSYTSTENESKIKINNYIIKFSNNIRLSEGGKIVDGKINNLNLTNIGSDSIDLSFWEVRNDAGKIIIPDGTKIKSGEEFLINGLTGVGIVSLFSPDEEKKDFIEIIPEVKEAIPVKIPVKSIKEVSSTKPKITESNSPTAIESQITEEEPVVNNTTVENIDKTIESNIEKIGNNEVTIPAVIETKQENTENSLNDNLKSSANENGQGKSSNSGQIIIFGILGIALIGGIGQVGMKYYKKRRI
ncbi:MAG: hypothetical protein PHZ26_01455 [Candidatus Gracilibacteria bacterium]|nr:hypothetical protein [Candidatus Gracilibacteria bacterium]MDD2908400.1 hypothetical protein [Candidatus Gracilibacteria bacterium]